MNALLIRRFLYLRDMKPLALPVGALQKVRICPADGTPLSVVATLVGSVGTQGVRVGWCDFCGYRAFMDRPTDEWLGQFYATHFDESRVGIGRAEQRIAAAGESDIVRAFLALHLSSATPVVDVGCGYGEKLAALRHKGFGNLRGIERSAHRASAARAAFGGAIIEAFFGDALVKEELQKRPPGVLLAHHVLEHVADPHAFLAQAWAVQQPGDFCILAVPGVWREGAISQLLFLPHLHSFSAATLALLAVRTGYALASITETPEGNLVAVLRRAASPESYHGATGGNAARAVRKLIAGLGLNKRYLRHRRRLWWYRKRDCSGQTFLFSHSLLDAGYSAAFAHFRAHCAPRTLASHARSFGILSAEIETPRTRMTSPSVSPLELQFQGPVMLLYK